MKGAELMQAVKIVTDETADVSFAYQTDARNAGRLFIGQSSPNPYRHVQVAPYKEAGGINPDATYRQVEVINTTWPTQTVTSSPETSTFEQEVHSFAEKLVHVLGGFGDTPKPSPWPQSAKVCALCERFVTPVEPYDYTCPVDGDHIPVKTVQVMLIVE